MSNTIESLIAKQDIYELVANYMRGLDRLDAELLRSVFHEDGWCEYGICDATPYEFVEFAMGALKDHEANQHMIGNVLIDIDGDQAFGEVYFNAFHKVKSESGFDDVIIAGRYIDRYERRDGVWKIAYRSERADWCRTEPTRETFFEETPATLRGGRQDDAVYRTDNRKRP
ncbi:MAG: nuclear transport factor 2 family protein [Pseudomonadales bacterium]